MHYYNENDPHAAQWLRNLIADKRLPHGDVDDRSIVDVQAADLTGYTQCHFFAGIGGWPLALRLAGWPDDRPVWTGSCPCQPFSVAGRRKGTGDDRHLWPQFQRIIADGKPPIVFGEQVASKDGRAWIAGVRADLEALGYAVGAADLCAAGVGAPHIRQRLFWVGHPSGQGPSGPMFQRGSAGSNGHPAAPGSDGGGVGHSQSQRAWVDQRQLREVQLPAGDGGVWGTRFTPCADGMQRRVEPGIFPLAHGLPVRMGPEFSKSRRVAIRAAKRNRRVRLSGYGNAIVPQVAAEFIAAYTEAITD